jgi:hypothetical protein
MKPALRALLTCSLLALTSLAHAADSAADFAIPTKQLDISGVKYLKGSKRVLVLGVNLEVMNWGKISSVTQTSALQTLGGASNSSTRSTLEIAVPSDVAALRAVAGELYADLTAKLTAAGWEVIPFEKVAGTATILGAKTEPVDAKLGAPTRKVNLGKQKMSYTIATPAGMLPFNWGMTMPFWTIRSVLKEQDANALELTYRFDPVALQGKSRHGIMSNTASTSAEANLVLAFGQGTFLSPKFAPGWVRLKTPVPVVGGVGEVKKIEDASPALANGISAALSLIAGGAINSKKGIYICEIDQPALNASLLLAGKTFNDEVVKNMTAGK